MKIYVSMVFMVLSLSLTVAQSTCYDLADLLKRDPELKAAQARIDKISVEWRGVIERKCASVAKQYKFLEANANLSSKKRKKIEKEIALRGKEIMELKEKWFGPKGELFKKREEILKQLQSKIAKAVGQTTGHKG